MIYIVSMIHPARHSTADLLMSANIPFTVVVHNKTQAKLAENRGYENVVVTGKPGLVNSRNYILKYLVDEDEWMIGMDDNIEHFERVHSQFYNHESINQTEPPPKPFKTWREVYRCKIDIRAALEELRRIIDECEKCGTIYGGFASQENPFFRLKHRGHYRFCKTKCFVLRNTKNLQFKGGNYAHDSWMSAYVVANYGKLIVNNYVYPRAKMYGEGGLGNIDGRREYLDKLLPRICDEFPGLVGIAKGKNSALRFLRTSENSINKWRKEQGYT